MSFAATPAEAPRRAAPAAARGFASVEVHADPEVVRRDWLELEPCGGGYQSLAFVAAWARTFRARLGIVVARDGAGRAVALLPLYLRRIGPLTVARFAGDSWANYHMGLFRPGVVWSDGDVRALLVAAGRAVGIGLFAFTRQPAGWDGTDNALKGLFGGASPSNAFASDLGTAHQAWLDAHFSRATQKKLRKKARKLETLGTVRHVRAAETQEAQRYLDAWIAQRDEAAPDAAELLRGLIDCGALEMHALIAGERIAATFGAVARGRRLSGVIVSYDHAPEIAAATPGEGLLIEVARDAVARGFATLDLGVGESRYKREICEIEEPLSDTAFGVTPLGRLAGAGWLLARAGQGAIKRRPWLLRHVQSVRRALKV